jgi:hypothetical protein
MMPPHGGWRAQVPMLYTRANLPTMSNFIDKYRGSPSVGGEKMNGKEKVGKLSSRSIGHEGSENRKMNKC